MHDCCELVSHQAEVAERVQPPCVVVSGWLAPGARSVAGAWPVSRHQPSAGAWPLPVAVLVASLWSAVGVGAQLMAGARLVVGAERVAQGSLLYLGRGMLSWGAGARLPRHTKAPLSSWQQLHVKSEACG